MIKLLTLVLTAIFISILIENTAADTQNSYCTILINSKSNYLLRWPLVFDQSGKLYPVEKDDVSDESAIKVKNGEQITLSCGPNYFKNKFRVEVLQAVCNGNTGKLTVDSSEKDVRELTCDLRVIEEVLDDVYGCADSKLKSARFGYVDPRIKLTKVLGEVCYDEAVGRTNFVHIHLGDEDSSHIEVLPRNYLTSYAHPSGRYKIDLFRSLQFDKIYERIRSTLHIHQAPMLKIKHFIDETLLGSAQFQEVKKLGWNYFVGYEENEILETLKKDIKRLSNSFNLIIYAGGHGVKQLSGKNGEKMEIYLDDEAKRFPVPSMLWFVVQQGDKATAFVLSNNADDVNHLGESYSTNDEIQNVCKVTECSRVTWLSSNLKHNEKLVCCNVADLRKTFQEIPILTNLKEILL